MNVVYCITVQAILQDETQFIIMIYTVLEMCVMYCTAVEAILINCT